MCRHTLRPLDALPLGQIQFSDANDPKLDQLLAEDMGPADKKKARNTDCLFVGRA